jgi:hypothetical protein
MAKPRKKARRPSRITADWTSDLAAVFGALPQGWTAPKTVRISAARAHYTVSGRFNTPSGEISTVRIRCVENAGVLEIVSKEMSFRVGGRPE